MNAIFDKKGKIFIAFVCAIVLTLIGGGNIVFGAQHAEQSNGFKSKYEVSIFAKGTSSYFNPDSVEVVGHSVYIGYQNKTAKDGTDNNFSTIVQYTLQGTIVREFFVKGHCDGLRFDPYTHLLWATSNEDGNPRIVTINPSTGVIIPYVLPRTPHGGGYDDVAFVNGKAFIAASNPTLNKKGVNMFPEVDEIALSEGQAFLTPVLFGKATARDINKHKRVRLNLTDPDSMTIDPEGDVVLDSQADGELVFLHHPGTSHQTVSRVLLRTQVDDTIWIPTSKGILLVGDATKNTTYKVSIPDKGFTPGSIYTEAPNDSSIPSFVGLVNLATGNISAVITGLGSPTGLAFIPD